MQNATILAFRVTNSSSVYKAGRLLTKWQGVRRSAEQPLPTWAQGDAPPPCPWHEWVMEHVKKRDLVLLFPQHKKYLRLKKDRSAIRDMFSNQKDRENKCIKEWRTALPCQGVQCILKNKTSMPLESSERKKRQVQIPLISSLLILFFETKRSTTRKIKWECLGSGRIGWLTRRACGLLELSMRSHLHVKVVAHPDIINWSWKTHRWPLSTCHCKD